MYAPDSTSTAMSGSAQQNARYAYLLGRLRNRQITMEEATELFGLMQGMLRTSEQARLAAQRAVMSTAALAPTDSTVPIRLPAAPTSGASDDLFLVGLLAMGAGAGLLAAMTKRIQDVTPSAKPDSPGRASSGSSSK